MAKWTLIVDDDEDVRDSLAMILELEGHESRRACNGKKALELLEARSDDLPALILVDMWMPVMDGVAFLKARQASELYSKVPTYLISADVNIKVNSEQLQATGYLQKPFNIEQLLEVVHAHAAERVSGEHSWDVNDHSCCGELRAERFLR